MPNHIPLESLPDGTALRTTAYWHCLPFTHYGFVQREWNGRVLIHHLSKEIGHAATTGLPEFADGNLVFIESIPRGMGESWLMARRARADIERGIAWTVADNCEDVKSDLLAAQSGRPKRDALMAADTR